MINALKAEFTKLTSLRSTWVYVVLMLGSIFGPATLIAFIPSDEPVNMGWADLAIGQMIMLLIVLIFAASSVAGDIGHRMVAHSFLTERHRHQWLLAKAIVIVVVVEVCLWVGLALAYAVTLIGPSTEWTGGDMYNVFVAAWTLPVYALMAAGLAAVTRSKLMGSGALIALFLVIEPLVGMATSKAAWIDAVYKSLPGTRASDLTNWHSAIGQGANPADLGDLASPAMAVTVILVWGAALTLGGLVSNQLRDVK